MHFMHLIRVIDTKITNVKQNNNFFKHTHYFN